MNRKASKLSQAVRIALSFGCVLTLLALGVMARAGDPVPFKGTAEGSRQIIVTSQTTFISIFDAQGEFTHFGDTRVHAQMLSTLNPDGSVHGSGTGTFTVADGDTAEMNFEGDVDTTTGKLTGTFIITGGSGRFAGATGQGVFNGVEDAQGSFSATFDGVITY
jgi:hypothetical protein